jgi:hypothetical protein
MGRGKREEEGWGICNILSILLFATYLRPLFISCNVNPYKSVCLKRLSLSKCILLLSEHYLYHNYCRYSVTFYVFLIMFFCLGSSTLLLVGKDPKRLKIKAKMGGWDKTESVGSQYVVNTLSGR